MSSQQCKKCGGAHKESECNSATSGYMGSGSVRSPIRFNSPFSEVGPSSAPSSTATGMGFAGFNFTAARQNAQRLRSSRSPAPEPSPKPSSSDSREGGQVKSDQPSSSQTAVDTTTKLQKPFVCDKCNKAFASPSGLRDHKKSIHSQTQKIPLAATHQPIAIDPTNHFTRGGIIFDRRMDGALGKNKQEDDHLYQVSPNKTPEQRRIRHAKLNALAEETERPFRAQMKVEAEEKKKREEKVKREAEEKAKRFREEKIKVEREHRLI